MTPRKPRRVLLIVQNCSVPFDQRVWLEAVTLRNAGYEVTVICPREKSQAKRETLHGIRICRHPSPPDASGPFGYALEYGVALFWEFLLTSRLFLTKGFDVLHASNPPDTIFIIGGLFKHIFSKKFIFDQHDICPELYEAKFGRRDTLFRLISILERLSFRWRMR